MVSLIMMPKYIFLRIPYVQFYCKLHRLNHFLETIFDSAAADQYCNYIKFHCELFRVIFFELAV